MVSSLDGLIKRASGLWPERQSLWDENGNAVTYRNLESKISDFFRRFMTMGVNPGDRVAILSRNSFDSVTVFFALIRARAVVVWLNHSLDGNDLAAMIADAGASILVYEKEFEEKSKKIFLVHRIKGIALERLSEVPTKEPHSQDLSREDDLACIVYTSGSTDKPLGVMLTHRNLLSNNQVIAEYLKLTENDKVCCVLPFYYIYGLSLLLSHVLVGGSVILENRFSYPQIALDTIETMGATGFSGVSSHYILLMNRTDFLNRKLPSLRYMTHAGDKMPVAVTEKLLIAFPQKAFYLMYGQTEAAPRISYLEPHLASKKSASAGKPLKNIELKIIEENGKVCGVREEGEIVIRGDNVMKGYWNNSEETKKVLRDGWLFTGDIAYCDEEGDFFVTGRKKQLIKVGGRRVSPAEVEALAMECLGVKEAAVIGAPDDLLGEKLRLYVVEDAAQPATVETIMDFYKKRVPFYKVPSEIFFVGALPRNSQGKIDRQRLTKIKANAPY